MAWPTLIARLLERGLPRDEAFDSYAGALRLPAQELAPDAVVVPVAQARERPARADAQGSRTGRPSSAPGRASRERQHERARSAAGRS